MNSNLKVIHLPTAKGNNAYFLSKGEKKKIVSHTFYAFRSSKSKIFNSKTPEYECNCSKFLFFSKLKALFKYIKIIPKYDIFHFNSGTTLTAIHKSSLFGFKMSIELRILKLLKKKIVVTFQGSDGRQPDFCVENYKFTYFNKLDYNSIKPESIRIRKELEFFINMPI